MRTSRCACGAWMSEQTNGFGVVFDACERGAGCEHERARIGQARAAAAEARRAIAASAAAERAAAAPPEPPRPLISAELRAELAAATPNTPKRRGRTIAVVRDEAGEVITGDRLRALRESKRIPAPQLAKAAGVSRPFLQFQEKRGAQSIQPAGAKLWAVLLATPAADAWPPRQAPRQRATGAASAPVAEAPIAAAAPPAPESRPPRRVRTARAELALVPETPASSDAPTAARVLPPVALTTAHVEALVALLDPKTVLALEAFELLRAAVRAADAGAATDTRERTA